MLDKKPVLFSTSKTNVNFVTSKTNVNFVRLAIATCLLQNTGKCGILSPCQKIYLIYLICLFKVVYSGACLK